jgi:hypothetical protein
MFFIKQIIYFIILLTPLIEAISIGIEIPPSIGESNDLLTDISLIHQELYSIQGGYSKNKKKIASLNKQLDKVVNDYLIRNVCLRYYLKDYVTFNDEEINSNINNGLIISLNFKFNGLDKDSRNQVLNLSILDKFANTLRRINKIKEDNLNILIDYPLNNKDENFYNEQYFDLCFENLKYDKSWNSKHNSIDTDLELSFGIKSISNKYKESSILISSINEQLNRIYVELDAIASEILKNLRTSEPELRNRNESNLTMYVISFTIIFIIYLIVNISQIYWLIKYLKKNGLI